MQDWVVRNGREGDYGELVTLNNLAVPHVNMLTPEEFKWLASQRGVLRVVEDGHGIAGFVLCLPMGVEYRSDNYKWFSERYKDFLYLDRVVVAERMRRRGVGRAMYSDLEKIAQGRWGSIALEVNLRPPNPVSIAFHEEMGYRPVGVREYNEGLNSVQMFVRKLS